jgi:hypothetical protein
VKQEDIMASTPTDIPLEDTMAALLTNFSTATQKWEDKALALVTAAGEGGITGSEASYLLKVYGGGMTGALSNLHAQRKVARLVHRRVVRVDDEKSAGTPYVLPHLVNGRKTHSNKQWAKEDAKAAEQAAAALEAVLVGS